MKKKKIDLKLKSYTISKFETGNIKGGTRIGCNEPIDLSLFESCRPLDVCTLTVNTCTMNNCGGGTNPGTNPPGGGGKKTKLFTCTSNPC